MTMEEEIIPAEEVVVTEEVVAVPDTGVVEEIAATGEAAVVEGPIEAAPETAGDPVTANEEVPQEIRVEPSLEAEVPAEEVPAPVIEEVIQEEAAVPTEEAPMEIPLEPVPLEQEPVQIQEAHIQEATVTEEIRTVGKTVEKVEIRETVVESYSPGNEDPLEEELTQVEAAILDLPNFTARRLANLEERKAEIVQYLNIIK